MREGQVRSGGGIYCPSVTSWVRRYIATRDRVLVTPVGQQGETLRQERSQVSSGCSKVVIEGSTGWRVPGYFVLQPLLEPQKRGQMPRFVA